MIKNCINDGLDLVFEEVERVIDSLNEQGAQKLKQREYEKAREAMELVERIEFFKNKIGEIKKDWTQISDTTKKNFHGKNGKKKQGKKPHSLGLPKGEFKFPLLEALGALGGSGDLNKVLELVFDTIKDELTEYDLKPIGSKSRDQKWRRKAFSCKFDLAKEGLIKTKSQRGIWELTAKGMNILNSHVVKTK